MNWLVVLDNIGNIQRYVMLRAVSVDGVIYVLGGADRAGAISNQGLVFSFRP